MVTNIKVTQDPLRHQNNIPRNPRFSSNSHPQDLLSATRDNHLSATLQALPIRLNPTPTRELPNSNWFNHALRRIATTIPRRCPSTGLLLQRDG